MDYLKTILAMTDGKKERKEKGRGGEGEEKKGGGERKEKEVRLISLPANT